jgi:hypothetical protein
VDPNGLTTLTLVWNEVFTFCPSEREFSEAYDPRPDAAIASLSGSGA